LDAATPLSMAEIQADKDQLRAEFAMSTRRLEISVEQMKAKTTSQLAELGKKAEAINRLKAELGEKTATIFALEAREKALKDQIRATEEEYAIKTSDLRETERALQDKEADLAKVASALDEKSVAADSQRIEIVSLRTQIEALKERISGYEQDIRITEDRLGRERNEAADATKVLSDERGRVENLGRRVGDLEQQLVMQTTEAMALGKRIQELEGVTSEQGRLLVEREQECDQLRSALDAAQQTEAELRADVASAGEHHGQAAIRLASEKEQLQSELDRTKEERAQLLSELNSLKREAESAWAAERVENALLRERINDVAAEVARMTVVLEGPNSPIEAILAGDTSAVHSTVNGVNGDGARSSAGAESKGNLAERMRALQSRASRVPSAT
ncbi:MAG: hypothetical protein ABUL48_02060, partial [Pseudorhodoplanes sp.]